MLHPRVTSSWMNKLANPMVEGIYPHSYDWVLCISLLCKLILCIAREDKKSSVYAHTCYKFTINYMIALSVLYVAQTISEEKLPKQLIYGYSEHLLCNCTCQNSLSHIHSPPPWLFSFAGEQPRANEREQRNRIQKNS